MSYLSISSPKLFIPLITGQAVSFMVLCFTPTVRAEKLHIPACILPAIVPTAEANDMSHSLPVTRLSASMLTGIVLVFIDEHFSSPLKLLTPTPAGLKGFD